MSYLLKHTLSQFHDSGISEIHQVLTIMKGIMWNNMKSHAKKFPNSPWTKQDIHSPAPTPQPPPAHNALDFPADMKKP